MPIQIKIQKGKNNVMTRFRQMLSANLKEKNITILFRLDACVIFDIHMGFRHSFCMFDNFNFPIDFNL